ncbi:hypothetical protein D0Z07_7303, partial [Hyphodiscus hymeniophilus]
MTGKFSRIDEQRCLFYARFMSDLTLPQANGVYWSLFMFVLILLCICANIHHKSASLAANAKSRRDKRRLRRLQKRFLGFVTICWLISDACAVFEVFALLNIQFCDGEDLTVLYWSFWGFLQVGSIIAIFGVILNLWIALADVNTPSWAVALGTPVLVFAALHWILLAVWTQAWQKVTGKHKREDADDSDIEEGSVQEEEKRSVDDEERKDRKLQEKEMARWTSR